MVTEVFSKDNQFIKLARQLSQRKHRDKYNLFLLEGIRSLEDVLRSDYGLEAILVNSYFIQNPKSQELLTKVNKGTTICLVSDNIFNELALTESPQGVLLIVKKKSYEMEHLFTSKAKFVVIADGIQDPGNLGTLIRTAGAAGVDAVCVTKGCVDIYNPKVLRASMGGIFFLPVVSIENNETLIMLLKQKGFNLVVADLAGQKQYFHTKLKQPVALIIGSENNGPSLIFKQKADSIVKIPMLGKVESLNAGVAAGILIYEVVRQKYLTMS